MTNLHMLRLFTHLLQLLLANNCGGHSKYDLSLASCDISVGLSDKKYAKTERNTSSIISIPVFTKMLVTSSLLLDSELYFVDSCAVKRKGSHSGLTCVLIPQLLWLSTHSF